MHAAVRAHRRCLTGVVGVALSLALAACGQGASSQAPHEPSPARRFFSPSSIWNAAVDDGASLDRNSRLITGRLWTQVRDEYAKRYEPTINITSYSVPIYSVGRSQPRVPVVLDRTEDYAKRLRAAFGAGVPLPPGARPAAGSDSQLVVWQPSTNTMWEFSGLRRVGGAWHAYWGGVMRNASRNRGVFDNVDGIPWGATATSLPLVGGLITLADVRRGRIDHALAIAMPDVRERWWSRPAQRTDGNVASLDAVPEGAHFRLDPHLDVASLRLPPLVKMMAQAAQRYGLYVRDKAAVVAFYAEDPTPTRSNLYRPLLAGLSPGQVLRLFPWNRLQLLKLDLTTWNPRPPGLAEPRPSTIERLAPPPNCWIVAEPCA